MTKCTFHKYGPSGTVTRHDGLCILALNIINEKVGIIIIIIITINIINEKASIIIIIINIVFIASVVVIILQHQYQESRPCCL